MITVRQLLIDGLIAGSIYALMALGFAVIYRTVRFFHFAHGVVYTAGAYVAYSLVRQFGFDPVVGFFLRRRWPEWSVLGLIGSFIVR